MEKSLCVVSFPLNVFAAGSSNRKPVPTWETVLICMMGHNVTTRVRYQMGPTSNVLRTGVLELIASVAGKTQHSATLHLTTIASKMGLTPPATLRYHLIIWNALMTTPFLDVGKTVTVVSP